MRLLISSWSKFWFDSFDYKRYRLFQVIFLMTVFVLYGFRLLDYDFLFSEQGILPFSVLQNNLLPDVFHTILPLEYLAKNPSVGFILHCIFIALIAFTLFFRNYWLLFVFLYLLHIVFIRRNPIAVYGVDMVATFWFFYSAFINPRAKSEIWKGINSVFYRLIQIQLCIIYAYSGFDKARGLTWWKGDALWFALGNSQISSIDFSFLAYFPWLVACLTFVTLLWEVYFPILIWIPQIKRYILLVGAGFHLAVAVMMNLYEFSFIMLAAYPLFLDKAWTEKVFTNLRRKIRFL